MVGPLLYKPVAMGRTSADIKEYDNAIKNVNQD